MISRAISETMSRGMISDSNIPLATKVKKKTLKEKAKQNRGIKQNGTAL